MLDRFLTLGRHAIVYHVGGALRLAGLLDGAIGLLERRDALGSDRGTDRRRGQPSSWRQAALARAWPPLPQLVFTP
jgi:hypothetical protein